MKCTWKHCRGTAQHPQIDSNGAEWANVCDKHNREIEAAIDALDGLRMTKALILASGGSAKMAADFEDFLFQAGKLDVGAR